jgi:serine/threonine protein kinase
MATTTVGGRYRIERPLGHGGMASVYLGLDTELERQVAIKLLAENLAGDEDLRERFVREARLAARLSDPNIVSVYDAGEDDGRPYIVMEHVDGETFADLLARQGRLAPDEARELAAQAARGLAHAHEAGLVHRDVKPQNLILRRDGTVKIADFGIARAAEGTALTQAGTVLGTAAYLAPEQAMGEDVTAAADVYSLGAVLYELLTGRPPFEFESLADLAERQRRMEITPVRELAPEVPPELEDVVMRCLARNPAYRPGSAGELASLLSAGGEARTQPLQRPTAIARRRPLEDRRTLWLALAGLAAVAAILLAIAFTGSGSHSSKPPTKTTVTVAGTPPAPIQQGADGQQQARNLSAWLKRYSGGR